MATAEEIREHTARAMVRLDEARRIEGQALHEWWDNRTAETEDRADKAQRRAWELWRAYDTLRRLRDGLDPTEHLRG